LGGALGGAAGCTVLAGGHHHEYRCRAGDRPAAGEGGCK
jgi:hypothetical protein